MMGTLKGFPNPPAMGSDEQSSSSPDAIESGVTMGGPSDSEAIESGAEVRGPSGSPDAIESGAEVRGASGKPPSRTEVLEATWREFYRRAGGGAPPARGGLLLRGALAG